MSSNREETAGLLTATTGYIYRMVRSKARVRGLRWTALMVLADLAELGESNQTELAEIEQVKRATMSTLIRDLRTQGLVSCRRNTADARVRDVTLTAKGRRYLTRNGKATRRVVEEVLAMLDEESAEALEHGQRALLAALRDQWG